MLGIRPVSPVVIKDEVRLFTEKFLIKFRSKFILFLILRPITIIFLDTLIINNKKLDRNMKLLVTRCVPC